MGARLRCGSQDRDRIWMGKFKRKIYLQTISVCMSMHKKELVTAYLDVVNKNKDEMGLTSHKKD